MDGFPLKFLDFPLYGFVYHKMEKVHIFSNELRGAARVYDS